LGVTISLLARAKWKWPGVPPLEAESWLIHAGIVVAVVGLLEALVSLWTELRALLVQALAITLLFLVLRPLVKNSWPGQFSVLLIGSGAVAAMALWLLIERTSERHSTALPPAVLTIAIAGLAVFESLTNSLDMALRAGALAATLGPIALIALWRPRIALGRGGATAVAVLFAGIVGACYAYTPELVTWRLLTIAALPYVGLALLWLPWGGWKRWAIALGPVVIVLATILILAYRDFKAAQSAGPW
jgi:hypothetical protein